MVDAGYDAVWPPDALVVWFHVAIARAVAQQEEMHVPSRNQERQEREARERLRVYSARQEVHRARTRRRVRDNWAAVIGVVLVAGLAATTQVLYFTTGPGAPAPEPSASDQAAGEETPAPGENVGEVPDPSLAEGRTWTGELVLNEGVTLGIELDGEAAPQAVASFVQSVEDGYYDAKTCHRLVRSEGAGLLQCGSLAGDGQADPEYSFGPLENVPADELYPAGTIAVARGADAYSQGRQFFIVFEDTVLPGDTGGYTVFGTVTSGLDQLVAQIADGGIVDGASDGAPVVPTTITSVTVQ